MEATIMGYIGYILGLGFRVWVSGVRGSLHGGFSCIVVCIAWPLFSVCLRL